MSRPKTIDPLVAPNKDKCKCIYYIRVIRKVLPSLGRTFLKRCGIRSGNKKSSGVSKMFNTKLLKSLN